MTRMFPHFRIPQYRSLLKVLHWSMVPLFAWFVLVQPADVARVGPAAVRFHSVMGLVFVSFALAWFTLYLRRGLASRPGPKLKGRLRTFHRMLHKTLLWGIFLVAVGGFLIGLTSAVQLWAGGVVPIALPLDMPQANDWVGVLHSIEFYALALLAGVHAAFHIWRHLRLRDNALRIMAPRVLHRFL
ncbi:MULTISPECIES: cytochrome b/b6 domain-containing protein [unclassified Sulfitobacter]|uniref:cytochrome b/b6 domain-containing protein n=1 Tax=unclassified Sulfitobacter TaxID=196795 RepID=UPI000B25D6DC|nr:MULTISPECIES: cytochrome b/b6 domain-containing protein [unclassified Sulfitobacter]